MIRRLAVLMTLVGSTAYPHVLTRDFAARGSQQGQSRGKRGPKNERRPATAYESAGCEPLY
ncbi:MAG: hypothetical protein CL681_16610, partial [Blastopirellula sp.]|nr:hypothetical protein [Blastopirellula sp.]